MCAGTVVEPPGATSAAIVSMTSISRSVAFNESLERSPCKSTLARIGMVLRRSTTRWTWPKDFSNSERSTVTFIVQSKKKPNADNKGGAPRGFRQAQPRGRAGLFHVFLGVCRKPGLPGGKQPILDHCRLSPAAGV